MPIPECWDSLLINGTDIREWGWITSAEGLLGTGPSKGDVIEQDWRDGAIWQQGPKGTYSFDVPVVLNSGAQDTNLGNLRALQAFTGQQVTLTRRLTVNGAQIAETCQAVLVNAVQVRWDFRRRSRIDCVLVFQNLSAGWSPA